MATAYAAFTSLMNLVTRLHEYPYTPIQLDEKQFDSLTSKINFFQEFLGIHHNTIDQELEIQLADAAYAAEDFIETQMADQMSYLKDLYETLGRVIEELDLIEEQVMIMNQNGQPMPPSSSQSLLDNSDENFVFSIADIASKTMDRIYLQHKFDPHIISISAFKFHRRQVDSLCSKIRFLKGYMKDHNIADRGLEFRIAQAAHDAKDHIETRMVHLLRDQDVFYSSLQREIEGFDLIKEGSILKMNQSHGNNKPRQQHPLPLPSSSSSQSPSATPIENVVVGIEDRTTKIVEKLTSRQKSDRQIISISGMGGIGKTTLARQVYNHPYINNFFDLCSWATISKDYNITETLLEIHRCLGITVSKESSSEMNEYGLGEKLHKSLFGRRYLVVLDDVWDVEAWEKLRSFFPDSSGSGIVITTRESSVATSISSHNFCMELLDERKSWDLFCKKVFEKDCCPDELERMGKYIAIKCRGLPLSIVVIGGHLSKSPRTNEYWEYIAKNLSSVVNSEDDGSCLKILSLSYNNLPVHLKPCFLYMGIFPEDEEIKIARLVRLWIAEGFVKPVDGKCHEETAKDYLNDLIARNIIMAHESSRRGNVKSCKIHDLLRDFCLKEVYKSMPEFSEVERFRMLHRQNPKRILTIYRKHPSSADTLLELLYRDLHVRFEDFTSIANLQYIQVKHKVSTKLFIVSPSICFFWNLQYLVVETHQVTKAPPEIWEMPQLGHINISRLSLSDPPSESNDMIMKNLQWVKTLLNFSFNANSVERFPNIKKLEVRYDGSTFRLNEGAFSLNNIARLEKLESFTCSLARSIKRSGMISNLTFPHSLKKLSINFLSWDDVMAKIGALPLLEVLQLAYCYGSEWNLVEGQFVSLKFLKLSYCHDLERFEADVNYFPCLQNLILLGMDHLQDISLDIGDISTLRSIELSECLDSAVMSAKEIAEVQYEMGNEELHINAILQNTSSLSESLSTSNFQVVHSGNVMNLFM